MFRVLSDAIVERGLAVLRVDDRGMGASTGAAIGDASSSAATWL